MSTEVSAYERVYKVQCHTFGVLRYILGLPENLATHGGHPMVLFRAKAQYRNSVANMLRKEVAQLVRASRNR
jgi:hypothetical protein